MELLEMKQTLFQILKNHGAANCGIADLKDVPASALPLSEGAAIQGSVWEPGMARDQLVDHRRCEETMYAEIPSQSLDRLFFSG